ncbi:MAG TPA: hypothetical protein VIJ65_09940 [Acidobacteriaceae bacterium]
MKRLVSFPLACFGCVCLLVATERRAMALYVDPGTGLFALQSAASVLAAAAFFMRRKIRALFGRKKETDAYIPAEAEKVDAQDAA